MEIDPNRRIFYVLCILCAIVVILFYWGYNDDPEAFRMVDGIISNKSLEVKNTVNNSRREDGLNVFKQDIKYRMKVSYVYEVDGEIMKGSFYDPNDFIDRDAIKIWWLDYEIGDSINVWYNVENPSQSRRTIKDIKFGLRYYLCGVIVLLLIRLIQKVCVGA